MPGERLEQRCSCASNCAHLHSPHHPPRRPENTRFQRMDGACEPRVWTDRKARRGNEKARRAGPPPPSGDILTICMAAPRQFLFQTLLVSRADASPPVKLLFLVYTAIKQNALFMKPFSQMHIYTFTVCCVCIYFNWIPPKSGWM